MLSRGWGGGISGKNMTKSTSISGDMCSLEKNDGSQSDTAVGALGTSSKKRRSSIGAKMVAIVGLSRKSRSASQRSQTGRHFYALPVFYLSLKIPLIHFRSSAPSVSVAVSKTKYMIKDKTIFAESESIADTGIGEK